MSFTTLGGELPTVTTSEVTNITTNSATGGGVVTSDGGVPVTEQGICWSTNTNPTIEESHVSLNTGLGAFTLNMTNLEHSTLYYVRAYAKNYYGVSYGSQVSFMTEVAELPIVTTSEVTNIMANTAKAGGVVTSEGGFPVTERGICWSMSSNPTIDGAHISSGSGLGTFNVNLDGLERNTKYYVRAYAENYYGVSYGSQVCFVTLDPPPGGSYNGHDYVDLGLPSGTLWATCNVGSTEGYGDYYAWGETQPKNAYTWSNYMYCNDDAFHLTKYCTNSEYGHVDHLTVLQAIDDAATVNWGSGWSTPTVDQWYELKGNTTCVFTNQNGMSGMLLISSNGNSIFLPAADYYSDNPPYWVGFQGHYHTSSLNTSIPFDNWNVSFSYTGNSISVSSSGNRCSGKSVRPVLSTK